MTTTANIGLSLMSENQQGAEIVYNESILILDALVMASAIDEVSDEVGGESDGDVYLVSNISTGTFALYAGHLAYYVVNGWKFVPPKKGMRVWVQANNVFRYYNGSIYTNLMLLEDSLSFHQTFALVQQYAIILDAYEPISITKLTGILTSGTCDVGLKVDGGTTSPLLSVTSTIGNITDLVAGGGGSDPLPVAIGQKVEFDVSNLSSPVDLQLMITFDRVAIA